MGEIGDIDMVKGFAAQGYDCLKYKICSLMKSIFVFPLLLLCIQIDFLNAQTPVIHLAFSEGDQVQNKPLIKPGEATYTVDLMRQQFSEGLKDYALDLSENAMYRRPWILDTLLAKKINTDGSFSVQVWVKTIPGATQGTPIIGNKKSDDLKASWLADLYPKKRRLGAKPLGWQGTVQLRSHRAANGQ